MSSHSFIPTTLVRDDEELDSSDDDDFVDVTDDEQTMEAVFNSFGKKGDGGDSDIDLIEKASKMHPNKASTRSTPELGQKDIDLKILNERAGDGYQTISQLINLRSTAEQPCSR